MPDWRISEIFKNDELQVLAVESVAMEHGRTASVYWLKGNIELQAVVVSSQGVITCFDNCMNEASIGVLSRHCPELKELISTRL